MVEIPDEWRRLMRSANVFFRCPAATILTGCAAKNGGQHAPRLLNKPAPDFELSALDGGRVKLADLRGKPVLLAFFAHG